MRYRIGRIALVILFLAAIPWSVSPTENIPFSRETNRALDTLNDIFDAMLDGLSDGTMGPGDFSGALEAAFVIFGDALHTMPIAGLLFADTFSALYDIMEAMTDAAEMFAAIVPGPYPYFRAILDAQIAKDRLRWAAAGGLIQSQRQCASGRALVSVYPGFDCYKLKNKLRELAGDGKCVTVSIHEAAGFDPASAGPLGQGPNAARVYNCLGSAFQTGPTFEIRHDVPLDEPGDISESARFVKGDPLGTPPVTGLVTAS